MIIDTSAVLAILNNEPEARVFALIIEQSAYNRISAANYVEAGAIIDRSEDPVASRRLDELIKIGKISIESVTETQAMIARHAYRDFGKGSGQRAGLNCGYGFT